MSPWRVSNPFYGGICHSTRHLNHSFTVQGHMYWCVKMSFSHYCGAKWNLSDPEFIKEQRVTPLFTPVIRNTTSAAKAIKTVMLCWARFTPKKLLQFRMRSVDFTRIICQVAAKSVMWLASSFAAVWWIFPTIFWKNLITEQTNLESAFDKCWQGWQIMI